MKKLGILLILTIVLLGILQFVGPKQPEYKPVHDLSRVPSGVNQILRKSCFDCHSTETHLHWYDKMAPANFFVYDHISNGRNALDFSRWDSLKIPEQNAVLYYSLNKILQKEMPLSSYSQVHPASKLTDADITILKQYLTSRTPRPVADSLQEQTAHQQRTDFFQRKKTILASKIAPSPNGIDYIPDFRNWQLISISDRFDNGTIRLIYGNEVAVNAIHQRQINPWPDGAILAKAAWKQLHNQDGSISPGTFVQVEFMIKDSKKYDQTAGWGWARWRGSNPKPYGNNSLFTTECISCHRPLKDNDYVFTRPFYLKNFLKEKIQRK
ncbi:hypothetical protein J2T02_002285 [Chitinophaga terrae (ex Kim and Jung 2007)]|uniref:cytochrome P460 family protein n=1 Tax=Chitinophaga terrae (ex Kim and Jung 2007) TaxID=408074 RepID=UPI00277D6D3C|nr:cytochrome P460 family protein [Chitinophaga terrae (ex Kim and Jung 2007)]MDQ0107168.1 hypothetical protein [Chitinophaga terrae (ex Kim and Jung 2007)]